MICLPAFAMESPQMAVKKLDSGRWQADVKLTPTVRRRKTFDRKADAEAWSQELKVNFRRDPLETATRDTRPLSKLVEQWHSLHGASLKDGKNRKRKLLNFCREIGDPRADRFTAAHFTEWRDSKLPKNSAATVNRLHSYLRAVFNELSRLGHWNRPNPLAGVRQFKTDEAELVYLTPAQIDTLLAACRRSRNPHVHPVALTCLATGARWSEAQGLRTGDVLGDRIVYRKTKGGRSRTVPIRKELADVLADHLQQHPTDTPRYFGDCYDAFRIALAASGITLPRGQASHVLRHTFASHYIQNATRSDALLSLQKLLGHSDIKLTLRYAHLAPDALESARQFNPVGHFWDTPATVTPINGRRSRRKKPNK